MRTLSIILAIAIVLMLAVPANAGCFSGSAVVVAPAVSFSPFAQVTTFATGTGFATVVVPTNAVFASPFAVGVSVFGGRAFVGERVGVGGRRAVVRIRR